MSKLEDYAKQIAIINPGLTVSNTKEKDKLAFVVDYNNNECACLLSFGNFHHCIIVTKIEESIKVI